MFFTITLSLQLVLAVAVGSTATSPSTCATKFPILDVPRFTLEDLKSSTCTWDGNSPAIIIVASASQSTEWKQLSESWSADRFLHKYGSTLVETVTPFEIARYGPSAQHNARDVGGRPMTLRHIVTASENVNDDQRMIFSGEHTRLTQLVLAPDSPATKWMQKELVPNLPRAHKSKEQKEQKEQEQKEQQEQEQEKQVVRTFISITSPRRCQGLPFHKHGKTYLTLVTGTKKWLVAPPEMRPTSNMIWTSCSSDYCSDSDSVSNDAVHMLKQKAGEILFLPEGWWHSTMNEGSNVSIGLVRNVYDVTHKDQPQDENFVDRPAFESNETSHFRTLLFDTDKLLRSTQMNRSVASTLRWNTRQLLWHQQMEQAIDAYYNQTPSKEARRPELCVYLVQVAIGSAIERLAREIDQDNINQKKFSSDRGATTSDIFQHVAECERALDHATSSGLLGSVAYTGSLVELARIVNVDDVFDQGQVEPVVSFSSFSEAVLKERLRLLRKATRLPFSTKARWELASAVCKHESPVGEKCRVGITYVLEASPSHGYANQLWKVAFPHDPVPTMAAAAAVAGSSPSSITQSNNFHNIVEGECAYKNLLELVHHAKERSANKNQKEGGGTTATTTKFLNDTIQTCVASMISSKQRYEWFNEKARDTGQTALMHAALNGDANLIELLCSQTEVDFEIGEKFGYLPFDGAAFNGHPNVLHVLIAKELNSTRDQLVKIEAALAALDVLNDATLHVPTGPLQEVRNRLEAERVQLSMSKRKPWDRPSPVDGYTPLWRAVWGSTVGHAEAVQVLIDEGRADVHWPCDAACAGPYETMLEYAVAMGSVKTVRLLLNAGAKVTDTALDLVALRVASPDGYQPVSFDKEDPIATLFRQNAVHVDRADETGIDGDDEDWNLEVELEGDDWDADENDDEWMEETVDGDVWSEE